MMILKFFFSDKELLESELFSSLLMKYSSVLVIKPVSSSLRSQEMYITMSKLKDFGTKCDQQFLDPIEKICLDYKEQISESQALRVSVCLAKWAAKLDLCPIRYPAANSS